MSVRDGKLTFNDYSSRVMNPLSKSLAVFNWASQKAVSDLTNMITKEKLQDNYEILEEVGRGAYGIVRKCERKSDNAMFAIKIILFKDPKVLKDIQREIAMMRKLHHSHLVALHHAYDSPGSIAMVMDYISGGELFERIIEKEYLTEKEAGAYLRQLIEGLEYMHSKNIIHLDIKPENILCVDNESERIKLIDFGLARELKPDEVTRCALGTPDFVAPEAISYNEVKPQTDMWSVGVLTYVLLSGLMPFGGETDSETLYNISNVDYDFDEDAFGELSLDAKHFIESLLLLHPDDRMTSTQALEHPWIQESMKHDGKINTKRHRTFLARRRWKKSVHVVLAVRKLFRLMQFASNGKSSSPSSTGPLQNTEAFDESQELQLNEGSASTDLSGLSLGSLATTHKDVNDNTHSPSQGSTANTPKKSALKKEEKKGETVLFTDYACTNKVGETITWKIKTPKD